MVIRNCAVNDDPDGCRSLICDANGIIIAEIVYRCIVCSHVSDSISDGQLHYQRTHMEDNDKRTNGADNDDQDVSSPGSHDIGVPFPGHQDDHQEEEGEDSSCFDWDINFSDREDENEVLMMRTTTTAKEAENPKRRSKKSVPSPRRQQQQQQQQKGGYVTCAVCNLTKFYQSVQRRYGQFTCMGCAKFFGRFLLKPKIYSCPDLGSCHLDSSSPRCKACLLLACIKTYIIDDKRMAIVNANRPTLRSAAAAHASTTALASTAAAAATSDRQRLERTSGSQAQRPQAMQRNSSSSLLRRRRSAPDSRTANHAATSTLRAKGSAAVVADASSSSVMIQNHTSKSGKSSGWGCKRCAGCLSNDCGSCNFCLDKPKFGGGNHLKKKCANRRCLTNNPVTTTTSISSLSTSTSTSTSVTKQSSSVGQILLDQPLQPLLIQDTISSHNPLLIKRLSSS